MFREALAEAPARRFFVAHAQSCLGTGLAYVALPLLAYERFHSAWAVSAVLLPDLLPAIILGPLLGALVDRVGWRTCATVADIVTRAGFPPVHLAEINFQAMFEQQQAQAAGQAAPIATQ